MLKMDGTGNGGLEGRPRGEELRVHLFQQSLGLVIGIAGNGQRAATLLFLGGEHGRTREVSASSQ